MARIDGRLFYFWDTSALAKRYSDEKGTLSVNSLLDDDDTVSRCTYPCVRYNMWKDRWDFVFFVTSDLNLASAARNEGFSTYDPRTDLVCHSSGMAFEPNR